MAVNIHHKINFRANFALYQGIFHFSWIIQFPHEDTTFPYDRLFLDFCTVANYYHKNY